MMRSYLGCVNQGFRNALKMIDMFTEENKNQLMTLGVEHTQLSMTLYHVLSMTPKCKALRIVQSVEEGHGYWAWWKLMMEREPQFQTRMLGILTNLLAVKFHDEARLLDDLAEWEKCDFTRTSRRRT